jgi:hypothetical protein
MLRGQGLIGRSSFLVAVGSDLQLAAVTKYSDLHSFVLLSIPNCWVADLENMFQF